VTEPLRVVLGVGGGIAAYKAALLLRLFTESGHDVTVVPTAAALRFVGAPTWEALSGKPVSTEVWSDVPRVPHVQIGKTADLVVVAPATADLLARAAHGRADDLLTAALLTARCPVLLAPAMHTEMWEHPATVDNVARLRQRGLIVLDPATGRLTGADSGPGRLPEPAEIAALADLLLIRPDALPADLVARQVVVSAGGTREAIDPVRFLGNASSGRQGHAAAFSIRRAGRVFDRGRSAGFSPLDHRADGAPRAADHRVRPPWFLSRVRPRNTGSRNDRVSTTACSERGDRLAARFARSTRARAAQSGS